MDKEIKAYLASDREATRIFMEGIRGKDFERLNQVAEATNKMWFAGLEKYGKAWADREYQLRDKK